MRAPRLALTLLALGTALGLAACSGSGGSTPTSSPSEPSSSASGSSASAGPVLSGTGWVLASYAGPDGSVAAEAKPAASLLFAADGTVSGSTGCNRFSGTYTQDGAALTVETGPMTMMACTSKKLTAQETAVVQGFAATRAVASGADGTIELQDAAGGTVLTYRPGVAGLPGTSWTATGINNGRGAVEGTATTSLATAEFGTDGTVSGSGGCNTYSGPYETSGTDGLTFGALASTKLACAPEVMNTELAFFAALGRVATYAIDGDTLTLRDEDGATQVTFTLN